MSEKPLLIGLVGDVLVDRPNPDEVFDLIRDTLSVPDVLMGNCECAYAHNPEMSPGVTVPVTASPDNIPAMARAGFKVLGLANNHALDAGHRGLFEMHRHLEDVGIAHCGTGRDLVDARRPAIVQVGDKKVAVLAYATFFPRGYEALDDWPGLAPIKSWNHYRDRLPNVWSPGTPPVVVTIPDEEDMENLAQDIKDARAQADVVIVQFHGGDYKHPFTLSDLELRLARYAVDHGAHAVAAHHHHVLRGMEWYKGSPIFYGLGHFVFDLQNFRGPKEIVTHAAPRDPETDESYDLAPRVGWPWLPWHRDARMTLMAWMHFGESGVERAGFLPCGLNTLGQVYPIDPHGVEGQQVVDYIRKGCDIAKLNAGFELTSDVRFGDMDSVEMLKA